MLKPVDKMSRGAKRERDNFSDLSTCYFRARRLALVEPLPPSRPGRRTKRGNTFSSFQYEPGFPRACAPPKSIISRPPPSPLDPLLPISSSQRPRCSRGSFEPQRETTASLLGGQGREMSFRASGKSYAVIVGHLVRGRPCSRPCTRGHPLERSETGET